MTRNTWRKTTRTVEVFGEDITVHEINNDANGNPRIVVHFLSLGVEPKDYGKIPGLKKYRAAWFGGGYVFQAYHNDTNIRKELEWAIKHVGAFYSSK